MDFPFQKNEEKKHTRLSIEYLGAHGFKAFKEESEMILYTFTRNDDLYIGLEHHNYDVESNECYADWWVLLLRCGNVFLKCNCDTVERFEEILEFFEFKSYFNAIE